jgi:hypothetical protein
VQERLDRVEPDLVVGNGDLVPAGATAVLAVDRRPEVPVRARGRLEQDAPDLVHALGGGLGDTWAH